MQNPFKNNFLIIEIKNKEEFEEVERVLNFYDIYFHSFQRKTAKDILEEYDYRMLGSKWRFIAVKSDQSYNIYQLVETGSFKLLTFEFFMLKYGIEIDHFGEEIRI